MQERIGHYRIMQKLGEGGMGEVYRATDTKLGRDVALKILPEAFAADSQRVARFQREAQVLASLNHPSIAAIYGIEESAEKPHQAGIVLAMELVEGPTLDERIAQGPLPPDEALALAVQLAEALEYAHEHGVIHRDLKPANIKLTSEGGVKILDFGLAKALVEDAPATRADNSPTLSVAATKAGMILGTAAYMSPEQAKGKPADKRADIWSFGVVLFEMLTGRQPFAGETIADILAAVVRGDPDWDSLPASTRPSIRRLIRRMLQKDPRLRLRDIGDARLEIGEALTGPLDAESAAVPGARLPKRTTSWQTGLLGGAVVLVLAAAVVTVWLLSREGVTDPAVRKLFLSPDDVKLIDSHAISPNGKTVAFTAAGRLWLRDLSKTAPQELSGNEMAESLFWSPNNDFIGYRKRRELWKVPVGGGQPTRITHLPFGDFTGAAWGPQGSILFAVAPGGTTGTLFRVSAQGGEPESILNTDAAKGDLRFGFPHYLPDGSGFFIVVVRNDGSQVIDLFKGENRTTLLRVEKDDVLSPAYSPTGHLLYVRHDRSNLNLWAVGLSAELTEIKGEPFLVAANADQPSVSASGTLVHGSVRADRPRIAWVDRAGRTTRTLAPGLESMVDVSVSPDGKRIALSADEHDVNDIYILNVERGNKTRLTFDAARELGPDWSPDGREIAYTFFPGVGDIYTISSNGGEAPRSLVAEAIGEYQGRFSKDGKYLAYYVVDPKTHRDLWYIPLTGDRRPIPFLQGPFEEALPIISPDGRFLAYQSNEQGHWEIYVKPFPKGEGRWQVSVSGGEYPRWSRKGDELYFVADNALMAAKVSTESGFRAGVPERLFSDDDVKTRLVSPLRFYIYLYDVAPDGGFVVIQGVDQGSRRMILVENWSAEFR